MVTIVFSAFSTQSLNSSYAQQKSLNRGGTEEREGLGMILNSSAYSFPPYFKGFAELSRMFRG